MGNSIKYTTGSESNSLAKGNFRIGTGDVGKGASSVTGFYKATEPPSGGYRIYLYNDGLSGDIAYYTATNDSELISFTNNLVGTSFTTAQECLVYYSTQTDKVCFNREYEPIVTNGLVLNVDAGFVPSYPQSGTTWDDLSGNGYDGTLTNGPTYSTDGGGSIVFDGVDDYVVTPSFSLSNTNNQISFDFWIKVTSPLGNVQTIFSDRFQNNTIGYLLLYYNSNGSITYQFATNTIRSQVSSVVFSSEFINTWVNVVITTDYVSKEIKFYRNSTLLSTQTMVNAQFPSGNRIKFIGSYSTTANFMKGTLPSMRLYNRTLTSQEILQNYNAQKARFGL
jgi:hypothetical protein